MRILAMFHAYVPTHGAGAEGMAHALLRDLVEHGHQVDVILSRVDATVPNDYDFEGVRVHAHQGKTQTPSWITSDMRPHVIVCHLENTSRAAVLGEMFKIPVVQLLHNHRPETMTSTLRFPFAALVCNSRWMAEEYQSYWDEYALRPMRSWVLTVRPPVFARDFAAVARAKPGNRVTLVNLTPGKGSHVFYALAERLPQYKFLGVQGAYGVQVIRRDLPNVEIHDHVRSHEMADLIYRRSKVVLMPSDYESYGRVAAEAACCGIPVVAHPTDGLREALGEAGIFHDRNDLAAWEFELRRLHSPRGWSISSKAVSAHALTLDPTDELELWRSAMEEVASVPVPTRHRG